MLISDLISSLSCLIASVPQSVRAWGTYKTLRPTVSIPPCGSQQTSLTVLLFDYLRADNSCAKACVQSYKHRRKSGIVRACYFKVNLTFLLAGIHQLFLSSSENRLAPPSPLPFPQTPNPTPQTRCGNLNMGDRMGGLGLCAMRPAVSLVTTKQSLCFARVRPAQALKSFCASRVLLGLRLFSLCRLLVCPFGNTTNKLLLVSSLKRS